VITGPTYVEKIVVLGALGYAACRVDFRAGTDLNNLGRLCPKVNTLSRRPSLYGHHWLLN
jgi:hypothetical protein